MLVLFAMLVGLVVGSFLNVVIYRYDQGGMSVFKPARSICPSCKHTLAWYDNIPVLSYLFLRGKCRYCGQKIAALYPFVESLTAGIFVLNALVFGYSWELLGICILSASFIGVFFVDFRTHTISDDFSIAVAVGGVIIALAWGEFWWHALTAGIVFAFLWTLGFLVSRLRKRESLGMGDVWIFSAAALALGPFLVSIAILLSSVLGLVYALLHGVSSGETIPFGPFIALGTYITLLCSPLLLPFFQGLLLVV